MSIYLDICLLSPPGNEDFLKSKMGDYLGYTPYPWLQSLMYRENYFFARRLPAESNAFNEIGIYWREFGNCDADARDPISPIVMNETKSSDIIATLRQRQRQIG